MPLRAHLWESNSHDNPNILVPFDFSSYSELALRTACELGQQLKAELRLVHFCGGKRNSERLALEQLVAASIRSSLDACHNRRSHQSYYEHSSRKRGP